MKKLRASFSLILVWLLVAQSTVGSYAKGALSADLSKTSGTAPDTAVEEKGSPPLDEAVRSSSLDIAALAEKLTFDQSAIQAKKEAIKRESKQREEAFKTAAKAMEKQIKTKERELATLPSRVDDPEINKRRTNIRCDIVKIKKDITDETFSFLQQQIAADVQVSKLSLLSEWRSTNQQLEQKIANRTIDRRPYGDVLNIGNRGTRKPFKGQERDIQWGQREIDAARQRKMFPQQIDDPVVTEYANRVASNLARNSDLQVPLKVFVVQQELRKSGKPVLDKDGQPQQVANAMALPGGFLIIFSGVILESENESELAGVVAHEMAHAAARHSNRLSNKGKVFSVVQLGALIGLQMLAPGLFYAASYLGYYLKGLLLQAIFDGMGIVFTVNALGVSRDFELEADQLGMQYAWKTGYDPEGFIRLFDHMSQKEGYASHTSFFATHPAFGDRILSALKEYKALHAVAPDRRFVTDTSEFQEVRARLRDDLRTSREKGQTDINKPSLTTGEPESEDCAQVLPAPPGPPPLSAPAEKRAVPQPPPAPEKKGSSEDQPPVLKPHEEPPRSQLWAPSRPFSADRTFPIFGCDLLL